MLCNQREMPTDTVSMVPAFALAYVLNRGHVDEVRPFDVTVHASKRGAIRAALCTLRGIGPGTREEVAHVSEALKCGNAICIERLNLWFSVHFSEVGR